MTSILREKFIPFLPQMPTTHILFSMGKLNGLMDMSDVVLWSLHESGLTASEYSQGMLVIIPTAWGACTVPRPSYRVFKSWH